MTNWPGVQLAVRVVELEAHLRGARRLVDDRHDERDARRGTTSPGSASVRISTSLADVDARQILLVEVEAAPTACVEVGDLERVGRRARPPGPSVTFRSMTVPSIGARSGTPPPGRASPSERLDVRVGAGRSRAAASSAARTLGCSVHPLRLAPAPARAPTRCFCSARSRLAFEVARRRRRSAPAPTRSSACAWPTSALSISAST